MTLEEAMDLVLNEAESSALGEGNEKVMEAVKMVKCVYDERLGYYAKADRYLGRKEYNCENMNEEKGY